LGLQDEDILLFDLFLLYFLFVDTFDVHLSMNY